MFTNSLTRRVALAATVCILPILTTSSAHAFPGYGSATGQFVLDGAIPPRSLLVMKGDPAAKDAAVCAAADIPSDDLVVDPATKGIQHIFIYMRKASDIKPELKESKKKQVVFDQKGCRFTPHSLLVRTDQEVIVKSDDNCAHNTHTFPIRGMAVNFLMKPNDREGVAVPTNIPEILPMQVKCDIHPWMMAYWLVLDHPYAAITDKEGKFTIEGLPEGEHEFRVWHERVGYIDRAFKVEVSAGKTTNLDPVKVPVAKFEN